MLVNCPECDGKVSTTALACPHCGAPVPTDAPVAREDDAHNNDVGLPITPESSKPAPPGAHTSESRVPAGGWSPADQPSDSVTTPDSTVSAPPSAENAAPTNRSEVSRAREIPAHIHAIIKQELARGTSPSTAIAQLVEAGYDGSLASQAVHSHHLSLQRSQNHCDRVNPVPDTDQRSTSTYTPKATSEPAQPQHDSNIAQSSTVRSRSTAVKISDFAPAVCALITIAAIAAWAYFSSEIWHLSGQITWTVTGLLFVSWIVFWIIWNTEKPRKRQKVEDVEICANPDTDSYEEEEEEWHQLPWFGKLLGLGISFGAIALAGAAIGAFMGTIFLDSILLGAAIGPWLGILLGILLYLRNWGGFTEMAAGSYELLGCLFHLGILIVVIAVVICLLKLVL